MLHYQLKSLDLQNNNYFTEFEINDTTLIIKAKRIDSSRKFLEETIEIVNLINRSFFNYEVDEDTITISVKPMYEEITSKVKESISKKKVIFPQEYHHLFLDFIIKEDKTFDVSSFIMSSLVEDEFIKNVLTLDSCTKNAYTAMVEHNEEKLKRVIEEVRILKENIKELKDSIYTDSLTKVYNRRWFEDHYLEGDDQSLAKKTVFALVNVYDLKSINENYGFMTGDKVLAFLAKKLSTLSKKVVYYSGGEFFVLFDSPDTVEEAHDKLHILREILLKQKLKSGEFNFQVTFSYSISEYSDSREFDSFLTNMQNMMIEDEDKIREKGLDK